MASVTTIVAALGPTVALLKVQYSHLSSVYDGIDEMCRELKRLQSYVEDAHAIQSRRSQREQNWFRDVKSLIYKVQTVLESYVHRIPFRKGTGFMKTIKYNTKMLKEAIPLHGIGAEIKEIMKEISVIIERMDSVGVFEESSSVVVAEQEKWLQISYSRVFPDIIVEMKNEIDELMPIILDDDRCHRAVVVLGMGGIGKTTLIRKIFHHPDIEHKFDALAWVYVSQICEFRSILEDIMGQLKSECSNAIEKVGDVSLVEELFRVQEEKKCLIVLDNMWNPKDWTCLHSAFPSKSKIVITTRNKGVATGFEFVHKMKLLKTSNALELLQKTLIYGRNTSQGDIMEKIGNKTITQCGHLPLAISAVGQFLWKEESLDGYTELDCDRIFSRSILEDESRCMSVLAMSYDDLPQHLQHCFLCLGVFSDGMIDIQFLYFMWMAEGIILPEKLMRGQTMLEVAEQYIDKLDSQSVDGNFGHQGSQKEELSNPHVVSRESKRRIVKSTCCFESCVYRSV